MFEVANRRSHYRAFFSLLRNVGSWEAARKVYGDIEVPVRLVGGAKDWATPASVSMIAPLFRQLR